jgi:membrane peptidoglycan carboxypeptidase
MASVAQIIRRRRNRREARRAARSQGRMWMSVAVVVALLLVVAPLIVAVGGAAWFYVQGMQMVPVPQETIYLDPVIGPTELYDRDGQILLFTVQDPLGDERAWLPLDEMPPYLVEATLLAEDPDFLTTTYFDAIATFSRLWDNLIADNPPPNDPSLTGRLVRNTLLPAPEFPTTQHMGLEIALVAEINRRYTPQEILEWHLNTNYYGHDAYGIDGAARVYFGKRAADLTLSEIALLTAIPTAPQYNPIDNEQAALGRQQDLLRQLAASGMISDTQLTDALTTVVNVSEDTAQAPQVAPEFAVYARRQAEEILTLQGRDGARMVARGGLRITTSLDLDLYYQSECALRTHLVRLNGGTQVITALNGLPCSAANNLPNVTTSNLPPDDGIIVVINVQTGELLSMVGQGARAAYQPGPVLQPFVYFQGFGTGLFNPATMLLDIAKPFPGAAEGLIYIPTNRDGLFRGPISLREAMSVGLLPPVVSVANTTTLDNILRSAHQIGLNSLNIGEYDLSLLERGGAISVLDATYAYTVFATMGNMYGVQVEPITQGYRVRDPAAVLRIQDAEGNVLWEYDELARLPTPIFVSGLGYMVSDILADREARWNILPQNNVLDLADINGVPRPSAVVNGMTSNNQNTWTVGYTPQLSVGVWLGRRDNGEMALDSFGLTGAAPVWRGVMDYVSARDVLPVMDWQPPDDITTVVVCQLSGLLPTEACPTYQEIFLAAARPSQLDTYWRLVDVNRDTGLLATSSTSSSQIETRRYFVPSDEDALEWWRTNGQPLPPTDYDVIGVPSLLSSVTILQPQSLAYVSGVVDIRGSLNAAQMQYYEVSYGGGVNPDQWIQITGQQVDFSPGSSLGSWDTTGLDGTYTLRLSVVLQDNSRDQALAYVTVDNVPPTITLNAGTDASGAPRVYFFPTDTTVRVEAVVEDNLAIDRVEFYHNGEFLGADQEFPYAVDWEITRTGTETFTAVVYDQAGNQAGTQIDVEVARAGG